jgi:hypothetical protein
VHADGEQQIQRRTSHTGRDMVISLVVLLIPVALIVTIFRLRGGEDAVTVDPTSVIAQARAAGRFPVTTPVGLPAGWRSVSAVYQPSGATATLRLGYLSPSGGGLQLVQSNEPVDTVMTRELGDHIRPTGTSASGWQRYDVRTDETALVRLDPGRTVIVVGQIDPAEMESFTASLR